MRWKTKTKKLFIFIVSLLFLFQVLTLCSSARSDIPPPEEEKTLEEEEKDLISDDMTDDQQLADDTNAEETPSSTVSSSSTTSPLSAILDITEPTPTNDNEIDISSERYVQITTYVEKTITPEISYTVDNQQNTLTFVSSASDTVEVLGKTFEGDEEVTINLPTGYEIPQVLVKLIPENGAPTYTYISTSIDNNKDKMSLGEFFSFKYPLLSALFL